MSHLVVVRIDREAPHLPDRAVEGMNGFAATKLCFTQRNGVMHDDRRAVPEAATDRRARDRTADPHAAGSTVALDRIRGVVSAPVLGAFLQIDFLGGVKLLELPEGAAQPDLAGGGVDQLQGNEPAVMPLVLRFDDQMRDRASGRIDDYPGHLAAETVGAARFGPDCERRRLWHCCLPFRLTQVAGRRRLACTKLQ